MEGLHANKRKPILAIVEFRETLLRYRSHLFVQISRLENNYLDYILMLPRMGSAVFVLKYLASMLEIPSS